MEAAQASLSLHLSKCHIVGNHMSRLISVLVKVFEFKVDVLPLVKQQLGRQL